MRAVDRSMNVDLTQGMVDGKLRATAPNRGGLPERATELHRTSLDFQWYGDRTGRGSSPSDERPDVVGLIP